MAYADVILADTPLMFLRFADGSGATATDSSGNGHDASSPGGHAPTWRTDSPLAEGGYSITPQTDVFDWLRVAPDTWYNNSQFTYECWFKTTDTATNRPPLGGRMDNISTVHIEFIVELYSAGANPRVWNSSGTVLDCVYNRTLRDGIWHHLVFSVSDNGSNFTANVTIDGSFGAAFGPLSGDVDTTDTILMIGAEPFGGLSFLGRIAEVAYYDYPLTSGQVLAHYQAGVPPPPPPANDNFVDAIDLGVTDSGSTTANNTLATAETGEPVPPFGSAGGPWQTLWWKWTAPSTAGTATFSTQGSRKNHPQELSSLDTVLAIYTGTTLSDLVRVAANDDGPTFSGGDSVNSIASFTVVPGTTYYIQVGGYNSSALGDIDLAWSTTPPQFAGQSNVVISASPAALVMPKILSGWTADATQGARVRVNAYGLLSAPLPQPPLPVPGNWAATTAASASAGAEALTVLPLVTSMPAGSILYFELPPTVIVILTTGANRGDTTIHVQAIDTAIPSGITGHGEPTVAPDPGGGAPPTARASTQTIVPVKRVSLRFPPPTLDGRGIPI